ncbi:MAG: hypothetical protein AB7C97_13740 [Oscillospiraceae bacterium]
MEYIIRVTDGEAEREATYEHGVQGMRRAAVIVLEDASIGEVLKRCFPYRGRPCRNPLLCLKKTSRSIIIDPLENSVMENALM